MTYAYANVSGPSAPRRFFPFHTGFVFGDVQARLPAQAGFLQEITNIHKSFYKYFTRCINTIT